jgi:hypothetical protein
LHPLSSLCLHASFLHMLYKTDSRISQRSQMVLRHLSQNLGEDKQEILS